MEIKHVKDLGTVTLSTGKCLINGNDRTEYVRKYLREGEGSATVRDICGAFGGRGRVEDILGYPDLA